MARLSLLVLLAIPGVAAAAPPPVTAVAYHPQGKLIAFGFGTEVRVFDPEKTEVARQFVGQGRVTALAFDPTGNWLAIASGEPGKRGTISAHRFGALAELNLRWNAHTDTI